MALSRMRSQSNKWANLRVNIQILSEALKTVQHVSKSDAQMYAVQVAHFAVSRGRYFEIILRVDPYPSSTLFTSRLNSVAAKIR